MAKRNGKQSVGAFKATGAIVYWTASGETNVDQLKEGLEGIGLGEYAPERTAALATLLDAIKIAQVTNTRLVRPLKSKNGFFVFDEERGEERNNYDKSVATIRIDDAEVIKFTESALTTEEEDEIRERYDEFKDVLRPEQVTSTLVKIIDRWRGTRLRDKGSVYFLPAEHLQDFKDLEGVVEKAGEGNYLYGVRVALDDDTLKAVKDAVTNEMGAAAAGIEARVNGGTLGVKALNTQVENAKELKAKIGAYEKLLETTLQDLRQSVEQAESAAAMAIIMASAADDDEAGKE